MVRLTPELLRLSGWAGLLFGGNIVFASVMFKKAPVWDEIERLEKEQEAKTKKDKG